ncbi:MAG: hypothetical protein Q9208_002172 [Pyrenodesmia sp. 3 TL-2023]
MKDTQPWTLSYYNDLRDPVDGAICQRDVEKFMAKVESNGLQGPHAAREMKNFCAFVEHPRVDNQRTKTTAPGQAVEENNFDFILANLTRLPVRVDKVAMTSEKELVRQRFRHAVQYIMTGTECDEQLGPEDLKEIEAIEQRLEGTLLALTKLEPADEALSLLVIALHQAARQTNESTAPAKAKAKSKKRRERILEEFSSDSDDDAILEG